MSDGPVKVGVAGLGRSGWNIHSKRFGQIPEMFKVVAVLDAREDRRKEAEEKFGCRTYTDYDELLKDDDVEMQVVAMPSNLHSPWSIQAMEAGKDVVCEKPMASSLADADKMIGVSEKTGKLLAIYQNRRYSTDFVKVKQVIDSGKLGRIVMIRMAAHGFSRRWDWQTLQEFGGGSLNNTGPHFMDQALQLFGEKAPEVFAHLECTLTLGDADDHVKVILRAEGAPMIDLEITSCCAFGQDSWLVMGTQGGLSGNAKQLKWKYFDPEALEPRTLDREPTPDRSYNRDTIEWIEESWDPSEGVDVSDFYTDLYATLKAGKPLVITPESVRLQMAVLDECHRQCPL